MDRGLPARNAASILRMTHDEYYALLMSRRTLERLPSRDADSPGLLDPATGERFVLSPYRAGRSGRSGGSDGSGGA